ncbi:MBL fold metallo-hydrolase [Bradyrhizobium vignae]|uniref:MBL fold metallo-hydrolase n=1 Tax=Bradyrhizobium vignae TaxID=1549949 RepID=UPI00289D97B1|nr:MBL fold metallo-hydrolase [Bradyrhizobium vignae]
MCGGGAALFSAIVATLIGSGKPVRAETITGKVPEIERVAVRVVVDSYQFAVAPSRKIADVDIEHFGWGIGEGKPPGKTLISEFGLSMHVESRRGAETRNILVDFGFTPDALVNNAHLVGIDPAALDALVLSHGHYDHFGGLAGFLKQNNGKFKAKLPIYIGGEEAFCSREWTAPPVRGDFGALDRKALEDANVAVTYVEGPASVADHGFSTGPIGQTSFEKLLSPSAMKIGVDHGIGCYADKLPEDERTKAVIPDQFRHEIATAFNLKGRGLIVLTSCSHRGVINAIKQAQAASGISKVHAVIGGFHLAPYKEDYVRETIAALKGLDIDYVIPLHCTGEPFYEMAKAEMPNKLLRSYTGTRFIFHA